MRKHIEKLLPNNSDETPLYLQLYRGFRDLISSGKLQDGEKLPTERDMSKLLGVSRVTLRKTLRRLVEDGYVHKTQGSGIFVKREIGRSTLRETDYLYDKVVGVSTFFHFEFHTSAAITNGAVDALIKHSYCPLRIGHINLRQEKENFEHFSKIVKALIVIPQIYDSSHLSNLKLLHKLHIPFVVAGNPPLQSQLSDFVNSDDETGIMEAVKAFKRRGHEDIAFLTSSYATSRDVKRRDAYIEAVIQQDLKINIKNQSTIRDKQANNYELGYQLGLHYIKKRKRPTAIIASTVMIGTGFYQSITEQGARAPDDVELLAIGSEFEATTKWWNREFPISTITIPYQEIGEAAARLIISRLRHPDRPSETLLLPTRMDHRETTFKR